jgi:hypothetical protein
MREGQQKAVDVRSKKYGQLVSAKAEDRKRVSVGNPQ